MTGNNQPGGNIEAPKAVQKEETNLSEIAKLVNGVMKEYIMPILRDNGLVKVANEIIRAKLPADDPKVIQFSLDCREQEAKISNKAKEDGCDEKKMAVITNYFSKLLGSVKSLDMLAS